MFKKADFIKSVYSLQELPPPEYPEIAILGRSNAGKSSLINALLNTTKLARVSSTPGFTQCLNFFLIDKKFFLVDLPGYGFAKVPKEVYFQWQKLIEGYLQSLRDFRLLILIFDIRKTPDLLDKSLVKFTHSLKIPFLVLLNKMDKLSKSEIKNQKELYIEELNLLKEPFLISCKEKIGLKEVSQKIKKALQSEPLNT